jgi:putative membrane-bound dehydrogenase-like protein
MRLSFVAAVSVGACWIALACGAAAQDDASENGPPVVDDYSGELPRIPPTSPSDALNTFRVAEGFRIELVAAEPDVVDPVALDFDENGRLFVVEMQDYSEQGDERLGRVRLLEDLDGDGRFEQSSLFADQLSWPTAVICYDGGVFVGAAPDILYLKDTDGDRRADLRRGVYTGFDRGNVQGLLNSFRWGLDNRIHGATSSAGARVVRGQLSVISGDEQTTDNGPLTTDNSTIPGTLWVPHSALELRGRDFAFDPRTLEIVATSGGGQHGMTFDEWGDKFVCSNSDHVQQVMFEDRYAARNPYVVPPPPRLSIAADGPQADVFRISPVEPWRLVRTRLRVAGEVPGPIERGGKAAGYFTSATGITIYDGDAWQREHRGLAIVGDVGGNLIHRKRLVPDGTLYTAHRIDETSEFVASSDIWFRPVQFAVGPDGGLYVADMYREVIEHPDSLPPVIKRHLDLTSGRDRGRIWRIVPEGFQQPPPVRLGEASVAELVGLLAHENGWHRRTAARLLLERANAEATGPLMRLAAETDSAVGRIHALYVLDGLSALDASTLGKALDDPHPRVRAHAVRLAETIANQDVRLRARLVDLASDASPHVHYQVAFSLGELKRDDARNAALAKLLIDHGEDSYVRFAALSSLVDGADDVAARLTRDPSFAASPAGREVLDSLGRQIDRQQDGGQAVRNDVGRVAAEDVATIKHVSPERQKVFEQYRMALAARGDADRGREVYRKLCISCHQLEGEGTPLGPNLAAAANRGSESVLLAIIDPNREVDPRFTQHVVTTSAGKTYAGAIGSETATSITLQDGENPPQTLLKIDVDRMENTQKSIMPEGMEKQMSIEQMADLLEYLARLPK